jgi:translation elongation factor EF-Ts
MAKAKGSKVGAKALKQLRKRSGAAFTESEVRKAKVGAKAVKQLRKDSGAAFTESEVRKALSNLSSKTIAEIAGAIAGRGRVKRGKSKK